MSRFQFIADEYPEIFVLCSEAEKNKRVNIDLSMLKARQALEKILSLADPDSLEDNLFDQINSLSGECSSSEMENMHTLRRLSNKAVHGETVSEKRVDEALKALLLSCCWLYFKVDGKSCPVSLFLPEDRDIVNPYVKLAVKNVHGTEQSLETNHGTNPLDFDNTFDEAEDAEQNPLDKDIFETEEEYEERIQQRPPVRLGFGIIDVKQTDSYTRLAFPRFSLLKNEKIIGADIKAFVGRIEEKTDNDYDGEILVALKVYKGTIQYDYSRVILKSGTQELPLTALYWQPFSYETQHDFQERMEQLPILPIGVCKPIKQKYDMDRQILPFQVSGFSFVQDVFRDHELTISADRHQAKQICQNMGLWRVYGGAQYDKGSCLIKAKSIINGKIQKTVQKGSDKIPAVHANVGDRQSSKFTASSGTQTYTEKRQHQADPKQDIEVRDFKDASAQNNLGNCYYYGDGVKKDYVEAVKWYRKAADQGDADAQYNLGKCYSCGNGVGRDYAEAAKWYRKAADQGDASAQNDLGYCYYSGNGVEQDYAEAVKWCRKAADQGDASAQFNLGNFYYNGYSVKKDYVEAVKWYRKAADQGDVFAQCNLGYSYYNGDGVKKDYVEAVKWYRKAADQGVAFAQYNLGKCYYGGLGVERDYKEAVKWYRKAADQGDADAQYKLGICYDTGRGVERDYKEAAKWYRKAADQGDEEAKEKLESLEKKSSSGCFITTAVCQTFGKPDDCYELTMFRRFRDMWLSKQPDGKSLISEYYAVAPAIVENIDGAADAEHVYQKIWELYLNPCLHYLENEQYEDCKNLYVDMVTRLKKRVS